MSRKCFFRLLALLYSLVVLLWLAQGAVGVLSAKHCVPHQLELSAAQYSSIIDDYPVSWLNYGPGSLVSTDPDPYLVWTVDAPVSGLRMCIRSSQPVQDPELYFTTAPGQEFSLERRLTPCQSDPLQGEYLFRLPRPVPLHSLRMDPTGRAGAFFELTELELNPASTAADYLTPSPVQLAAFAVLPALTALALRELLTLPICRENKKK